MPLYRYKALTKLGETVFGEMEATTEDAVINWLHESDQIPIDIERALGKSAVSKTLFSSKKSLSQQDVNLITSKLAIMLRAGLPLDNALALLVELIEPGSGRKILEKVRADVQNGAPLSEAMQPYPDVFNKLYINTLKAGEAAGAMDMVLARLADYLERSRALKETIKSAMIYPAIIFTVALFSLTILLIYVVPQFGDLFAGMEQAMPLPTAIVIRVSEFLQSWWWLLALLILTVFFIIKGLFNHPLGRKNIDRRLLKMPLIGDLIKKVEVARFSRTLGTLITNGVPLLNGLTIVSETVSNTVMSSALDVVSDQLREGKGMAKPLAESDLFPSMAVQLIHVGEETGELDKMLNQLADIYDTEVEETVKRLLTLLEPALIIGLGVIIAIIIMSILLAILGLNEFAV